MVQFVADDPREQRRVIPVPEHLATESLQLRGHGLFVVVVESPSLGLHGQTQHDRDPFLVRAIEECLDVLRLVGRGPVADRVAAVTHECIEVVDGHAGAPDLVGFASAQELIAGAGADDLDLDGPGRLLRDCRCCSDCEYQEGGCV